MRQMNDLITFSILIHPKKIINLICSGNKFTQLQQDHFLSEKSMRSLYSKDILDNPYRVSPFQQRSRLKSLKELRQIPFEQADLQNKNSQQQILQLLEKKLVEDNFKQENQQTVILADPKRHSQSLTSKHTIKQQSQKKLLNLKQSNKLFQYFEQLYKKQAPVQKVEREKVNFCERQFDQIKTKVQSKLEINKKRLEELQERARGKYLELHEYHEQAKELGQRIRKEKKAKVMFESQKKQRPSQQKLQPAKLATSQLSLRPPSLKQKLFLLEQTISYIKQQTSKLQQQIQATSQKQTSIQQEWTTFLKLFLNGGYYLSDGCERVLGELRALGVKLSREDLLAEVIDESAKGYLLACFEQGGKDNNSKGKRDEANGLDLSNAFGALSKDTGHRDRLHSNIQMKALAKDSNLKAIYSNTKSAMINLLKNSSFKASPQTKLSNNKESFLPKIQPRKQSTTVNSRVTTDKDYEIKGKQEGNLMSNQTLEELKRIEINRINYVYFGNGAEMEEKGKLLKRILFGFGVK